MLNPLSSLQKAHVANRTLEIGVATCTSKRAKRLLLAQSKKNREGKPYQEVLPVLQTAEPAASQTVSEYAFVVAPRSVDGDDQLYQVV